MKRDATHPQGVLCVDVGQTIDEGIDEHSAVKAVVVGEILA